MKKQQKYSIVMDMQNRYSVVFRYTGIAVYGLTRMFNSEKIMFSK